MAKDFFGSLGETLTKTAKELSGRAEEVYETQRLKNKIFCHDKLPLFLYKKPCYIYSVFSDFLPAAELPVL